jgi:hypothetical protein
MRELARVLVAIQQAQTARATEGPAASVARFRAQGRLRPRRQGAALTRLRRFISVVDRFFPGGPNCYRRVLAEIALDAGAADEPLHLGLARGGSSGSGHAWLGDRREPDARYDVELVL